MDDVVDLSVSLSQRTPPPERLFIDLECQIIQAVAHEGWNTELHSLNLYSARVDFRRQDMTSVDVRF